MKDLRRVENLHVFLWLLKDCSWAHTWKILGSIMIAPTLIVQLYLVWHSRKDIHDVLHNIAVALWISANATWMLFEFFWNPEHGKEYARYFFNTGLCIMVFYYLFLFKKKTSASS